MTWDWILNFHGGAFSITFRKKFLAVFSEQAQSRVTV
jgi:hypothetical protein